MSASAACSVPLSLVPRGICPVPAYRRVVSSDRWHTPTRGTELLSKRNTASGLPQRVGGRKPSILRCKPFFERDGGDEPEIGSRGRRIRKRIAHVSLLRRFASYVERTAGPPADDVEN